MTKLGVLDQSPIREGATAAEALRESVDLAKACERFGYHRYWVAEHHNTSSFAGSAPEILIGRIASETRTIRIGAGGVMLPHYSPLKVAECFKMLDVFYPGRIDLGLGRAPGADPRTSAALQPGPKAYPIEVFPQQIDLLQKFIDDDFPPGHPYQGIHAMPVGPTRPEIWMLGSSVQGALYAAEFGLPYCHAHFITPEQTEASLSAYRSHFKPGGGLSAPYAALGVNALAADTPEQARHLAKPRNLWVTHLLMGTRGRFISPELVDAHPFTPAERSLYERVQNRGVVGSGEECRDKLTALGAQHGVDEFILLTITYLHADRIRSYERIAAAFAAKSGMDAQSRTEPNR